MAQIHLGSVLEGTLRTEDLLDAFADTLAGLARQEPQNAAHLVLVHEAQTEYMEELTPEQVENASELVNELQDAIQEYCPPFVFFGSHPGDGADFGFWPDLEGLQDAINEEPDTETDDDGEKVLPFYGIIVQTSDHGNVTVMDMDRQELWSCG